MRSHHFQPQDSHLCWTQHLEQPTTLRDGYALMQGRDRGFQAAPATPRQVYFHPSILIFVNIVFEQGAHWYRHHKPNHHHGFFYASG